MRLRVLPLLLLCACVLEEAQVGPIEVRLDAEMRVVTPGEAFNVTLTLLEPLDLEELSVMPDVPKGFTVTQQRVDNTLVFEVAVPEAETPLGEQTLQVEVRSGQREGRTSFVFRVVRASLSLTPETLRLGVGEPGVVQVDAEVQGADDVVLEVEHPALLEVAHEEERVEVTPLAQCDPCRMEVSLQVEGRHVASAGAEVRTVAPTNLTLTAEPRTLTLAPDEMAEVSLVIERGGLEGPVNLTSAAPDGFALIHTERTGDARVPAVLVVPEDAQTRAYVIEVEASAGETVAQEEIIVSVVEE